MEARLTTYHLRKFVNAVVDSTETSPSLAEMVHHHLEVSLDPQREPPFHVWYVVHDDVERWIRLRVVDARGYPDDLYRRGAALLRVGVNGALASPDDDRYLQEAFGSRVFRTCKRCGFQAHGWFEYYGHLKLEHWATPDLPREA
jgi:hypothetical protein